MSNLPHVDELLSHAAWIRALARHLVADSNVADDLVQETWVAALEHPPATDRHRPWLAQVLRNFARQRGRSEAARERRERSDPPAEDAPSPARLLERAETQRLLVEAVTELDDPYRSTLLLHFYEGLSCADIARRTGQNDATVRSHLRRGIERLRARLDARHGGDRSAWCAALAPLARRDAPGAAGTPALSAAASAPALGVLVATVAGFGVLALGVTAVAALSPDETSARPATPSAHAGVSRSASTPVQSADRARESDGRHPLRGTAEGHEEAQPVRGRVLDAATGRPVADYAVRLLGPGGEEVATTDPSGLFESRSPWAPGELTAWPIDDPEGTSGNKPHRWVHPSADSVEVRVHVGPSYSLDFAPPPGKQHADFLAMFSQRLFALQTENESTWNVTRIRPGPTPWLRFSPLAAANAGAGPQWRVEVVSRDGLLAGEFQVEQREGVDPQLHRVELAPRGAVRGHVLDERGRPVGSAGVSITCRECDPPYYVQGYSDHDGSYRFRGLREGEHALQAGKGGYELQLAQVTVETGRVLETDLVLEATPPALPVEGIVRSATGTYSGRVFARLQDGEGRVHTTRVEWSEEESETIGRFRFERVGAARDGTPFTVWAQPDDLYAWDGNLQEVVPGQSDIELFVHDDAPTYSLGFRILDDATGEPIPACPVRFCVGERSGSNGRNVDPGEVVEEGIPQDAELWWAARAPGHVPVFGTAADLEGDGDERFACARLRRGWGARFRLMCDEPFGAELSLDDVPVGTFDADGWLVVELATAPRRLAVTHPGWEIAPESTVTEDGVFDQTHWSELRIHLRRTDD